MRIIFATRLKIADSKTKGLPEIEIFLYLFSEAMSFLL
jgi:hypothetical protein